MRDFFKIAAASAVGTMVGLFSLLLLLGIGAFGLIGVLIASSGSEPELELEDDSVLVFDLSTDIVDGAVSESSALFEGAFYGGTRQVSLYNTLAAINAAADDEKISGIYIKGLSNEGLATLKEVRQALSAFKESGKPIWAYNTGFDERGYYIASVADNLVMAPVGTMEINGFGAETQYLANALDKYGVGVQVLRVGKYKSAVEPFTRSSGSPESKQQTQALVNGLWQDFLQTVSSDRKTTPEQIQTIADSVAVVEADEALSAGFVDRLAFYGEVVNELRSLSGVKDGERIGDSIDEKEAFPQISLAAYAQKVADDRDRDWLGGENVIGLVYAEGNIIVGEETVPGSITSQSLSKTLRQMRKDDSVRAVVLRVNSPGGSAIASEVITDEVQQLAEVKPLIVSMGDYAASGGYMIAAPGSKIVASPNTITGSIGVYGLLLNFQEIANENGITWDVVKTAKFADMQTIARPQSSEELKIQQDYVDTLYERFMTIVAEGREITMNRVSQVGQGRVWTGQEAVKANLVDEIGGLERAIVLAAESAEIEEFQVQEYPRLPSFEEQLFDSLFGAELVSRLPWNKNPLTDELLKLHEELTLLDTLNDPNNMYMRLPFTTEID